jgi:high-affinity Fe2+/Pb2+ permease
MAINMNWGALGIGAVVAFVIGWLIFDLLGAIILAIVVCALMGILTFK